MIHQSRLGSLSLLILLLLSFAIIGTMTSQQMTPVEEFTPSQVEWLAGWQHRKLHTITGSAGAGTNYQVKITVHRTTGTDSGGNVYVGTNCKSDFGDIRFTDDDGVTVLDYWLQESTVDSASIWVEVLDSLDTDAEIYLYYDNPSAVIASNGNNTFIAFDNFDDYSPGATPSATYGWTDIDDVYIQTNPGGRSGLGLKLDTAISTNSEGLGNDWGTNGHDSIAIHYMWYCDRVVDRNGYTSIIGYQDSTITTAVTTLYDGQFSPINREWYSGSTYSVYSPSFTYTSGVWYEIEDRVRSNYYHCVKDGVDLTGGTRSSGVDDFYAFQISTYQDNRHGDWFTQYDDFFVRKWIESEPSHGAWDSGLVASWSFNEGSGIEISDSSGNGNDGTIYGATWVAGVDGNALSFDGTNDYVRVPSSPSIESISDSLTLVVLAKTHSYRVNTVLMMSSTTSTPPENRMHFVTTHSDLADNKVRFTQFRSDSSFWYDNFEYVPQLNEWILYHVVVHSNGNVEFYVNGTLVDTASGAPGFYSEDLEGVYLGTDLDNSAPTDFFDGDLDQLSIYNRPLTSAEIEAQYNQLFGIITTTETTTTTTTDSPTTGNSPSPPLDIFTLVIIGVSGGSIVIIVIVIILFRKRPTGGGPPDTGYSW